MTKSINKIVLSTLGLFTLVFIVGRFWGAELFDNGWSFSHWQFLPFWYPFVWLISLTGLIYLFCKQGDNLAQLVSTPKRTMISGLVLFGLLFVFQFDSFLYGGGNLRVAQLSQADKIILRWFEYGTVGLTMVFFKVIALIRFLSDTTSELVWKNHASVYSWKLLAWLATAISMVVSWKTVRLLCKDVARQLLLLIVLFFGPQTLIYFGFIGVEPVVVAFTSLFALNVVLFEKKNTGKRLLMLWLVTLSGLFWHISLAFLIPAAIYISLRFILRKSESRAVPLAGAIIVYAGLIAVTYWKASTDLELTTWLLFFTGKRPYTDYGLFSPRHLGDIIQIFWLVFPHIIVMKVLSLSRVRESLRDTTIMTAFLMSVGGLTVMMMRNPTHSVIVDLPRMLAYLSPYAFLATVLLARHERESEPKNQSLILPITAALAIIIPLAYLPNHIRITNADGYISNYFDKHETYYYYGCLMFRDAYFYIEDNNKTNANRWESAQRVKSPDFLLLEGISALAGQGKHASALNSLSAMIAQHPYWADPRGLGAAIHMNVGRLDVAKPLLDTALLLEPYRKEFHNNLFEYYRRKQMTYEALTEADIIIELFPSDMKIKANKANILMQSDQLDSADELLTELLKENQPTPMAYMVKGMVEDKRGNLSSAIKLYKQFIRLAPDDPDTPAIQRRLDNLVLQTGGATGN